MEKNKLYKLVKRIGEGACGKAYLVENTKDKVIIKEINKVLCVIKTIYIDTMDEKMKKEALIEATILQRLDHPNIIKFKETFTMKKPKLSLCIVMEYCDGGDLKSRINAQKGTLFDENLILDWFTQISLAVKHIHDRKILHRDLKSQNIFLNKDGIIKLGDFGIAKCLNFTLDKATTYKGTPYYLSPEIVQNSPYSFKSDIWSLGVLLYEMCCLKMPYEGNNIATLSLMIINGIYSPLPSIFSEELKNLLNLLLCVNLEKRIDINGLLEYPLIKSRIRLFLNEYIYNSEFSHTILHEVHPLKKKGSVTLIQSPNFENEISCISDNSDQQSVVNTTFEKRNTKEYLDEELKNLSNINDSINSDEANKGMISSRNEKNINSNKKKKKNEPDSNEKRKLLNDKRSKKNRNLCDLFGEVKIKHMNEEIKEHKKYINNFKKENKNVKPNKICEEKLNETNFIKKESTETILEEKKEKSSEEKDEFSTDAGFKTAAQLKKNMELNNLTIEDTKTNEIQDDVQIDKEFINNLEDVENNIANELENLLGKDVFSKVYKIVNDSIPDNSFSYNHEELSNAMLKGLIGRIDGSLLLLCIEKIHELYSLVIKEREIKNNKNFI